MSTTNFACTIYVDGTPLTGADDIPLIDFLEHHNYDLPHICYHPTLGALESCDSCWIEIDGELQRGCSLRTSEGLSLSISSPRAESARREGVDRIAARHELYCTVCENNNGDCKVHNVVKNMEVPYQKYDFQKKPYPRDESHPFYVYDPDQCILCGRCVEACQNIQVTETLSIDWEREHPRVLWDGGENANQSSCVSCGHCVTVCPCNALMEKSMLKEAGPLTAMPASLKRESINWVKNLENTTGFSPLLTLSKIDEIWRQSEIKKTKTVCTFCGVGCSFDVWTRDRHILKIQPREEAPVNGISTCIKGKFGWDFVNSAERLQTPLIRENGHFREASWDEAYALIARRFQQIREQTGADSLAFVASSKCTCEESYLMQKFARAVIGTNNIDNCSRYCQSPATKGLWRTMGYGGDGGSISDLESAQVLLIVGSNTAESHPVLATRLKQAKKHRGQTHIVVDLRKHEMAERADVFLRPKPSTDLVWLSAITKFILDNNLADHDFLDKRVEGFDRYRESLEPFTLAFAETETGISIEELKNVAYLISTAETACAIWAMGVTQHKGGSDTSTALANLLLVTGNSARPGTGAYPMRGHNNVQGCSDFGSMPGRFPGYEKVSDDQARDRFEKGWGVKLPSKKGYNNHTMVQAMHDEKLKSLYVIGEDMAIVDANALTVQNAFNKLDFMVVQDIFFTRTCEHADVVLPASPSLEKEGTFVNTERRLQRLYEVMSPLTGTKPDWQILTELAQAMGTDWDYQHPSDIMDEAASLTPMFAGASYARLEGYQSLQWPIDKNGQDTPHLYRERYHFESGKARLFPLKWQPPAEEVDNEFDLHVNNGRLLETFHEGNLTHKSAGIRSQVPGNFVEISPQLARERGITDGTEVKLTSRRGSIRLPVVVTDRVKENQLYVTENATHNARQINVLTSNEADRDSSTPAYKEIAVKMERVKRNDSASRALPSDNFRYGNSTPSELNIQKKWERADYNPPPNLDIKPERR